MAANSRSSLLTDDDSLTAKLNRDLKAAATDSKNARFHGDNLRGDKPTESTGLLVDLKDVFTWKNASSIGTVAWKKLTTGELDMMAGSALVGSLPSSSANREAFIENGVVEKYQKMLHPPLTYLGDAFQYRTADGKFNNVLSPHLGQAGAPYAKTVPSKTHVLGALPDPGDIFERLMSRGEETRESQSGLSSMLLYHATIIIHDIFRTNDSDKNISDSSSYLDLSPLYGYTQAMQREVRDDKYKLGLLKPDTFAEDRLLRQPPGVCIMLVMYNRYHNYAATQLRRINENGRFSVPRDYAETKLVAIAEKFIVGEKNDDAMRQYLKGYKEAWVNYKKHAVEVPAKYKEAKLEEKIDAAELNLDMIGIFEKAYDAAWDKLDDDLFNTARLITCGIYVNISIHDYLRALMGFHQYNSTFTLDPRVAINRNGQRDGVSRGIGNQVTTEFNLLYRFHCAISKRDEQYTRSYMKEVIAPYMAPGWEPEDLNIMEYMGITRAPQPIIPPSQQEFGLHQEGSLKFSRNSHSNLFDDEKMVNELLEAMDAKVGNFGALNVPRCMKSIEIMGIIQARKWEVGTLNDFRDFFGMPRHKDFASITKNTGLQNALRDLYDHPDKVELYPGIFCEGDKDLDLDPGPKETTSALWAAIFSDAITLVRSDRFYTVDWNTKSLTSWGMKEVTPTNEVFKTSVFHRLIQRAFPAWFPHNSVRFFHPFYTGDANIKFAKEQGYMKDFSDIKPGKPWKPIHLQKASSIQRVLLNEDEMTCSLTSYHSSWMPKDLAEIMAPGAKRPEPQAGDILEADAAMVLEYFTAHTRNIINREVYAVKENTYQVDVIRDVAVPVIIQYVSDFLGFTHRIKSSSNPNAEYTDQEIFQHITNCHVLTTYMVDETKIFERRMAAKKSLEVLLDLTRSGHIRKASHFSMSRLLWGDAPPKDISQLGMAIARQTLRQEKNQLERASAVLLATALDGAYTSVLAFSTVLNSYLQGLYVDWKNCEWMKIQELAWDDDPVSDDKIRQKVLHAQRVNVRIPIVRRVLKDGKIIDDEGKPQSVKKDDVVICDLYQAPSVVLPTSPEDAEITVIASASKGKVQDDFEDSSSSRIEGVIPFNSHEVTVIGLTAMIKVLAQTRNLRRGHDTQGKPKKIHIDETHEGYANYMAPLRMTEIREKVKYSLSHPLREMTEEEKEAAAKEAARKAALGVQVGFGDEKDSKPAEKLNTQKMINDAKAISSILDSKTFQPQTDTYLTPEWDEMIPFPTTWKVRFDLYGKSDYSGYDFGKTVFPDNVPPFYQVQGASHYGGTFGQPTNEEYVVYASNKDSHDEPLLEAHKSIVGGCGALGR